MKHQPYESWLYERETLTKDQARDLEDHLEICDSCRALATAWADIEGQLFSASLVAPAPGFSRRWRARLADHRRRVNHRQMGALFLTTAVGLAVLSVLFGVEILPLLQPAIPTLVEWGGKVANLVANLNVFRLVMGILVEASLENIPLVYRVVLPLSLAVLAAFWVFSLHRLNDRRIKKGVIS
jgi:predicted anti-sigma-YlaC factor YlaD